MIRGSGRRAFIRSVILQAGAIPAVFGGQPGKNAAGIPLIAFRIGVPLWQTDERFDALLDFFRRQPGAVDELAFFTSATHPPLPVEEMRRRAARLGELLPRVRREGMQAGINVLATIGHHNENLPNSLQEPWQRIMDPSGSIVRGTLCPAHPETLAYVRAIYTCMADAGPDFLWVDDDVRLQGHGAVRFGCFCDLCVRRFSEESGASWTREKLVAAFGAGPLEERLALRRRWLEHNRTVIDTLLRNIEETVHRVKPELPLGFMTGDRFYEGYAFARWARTLSGPGRAPVRWRPGGGFYSDETLLGLVDKAHAIGRQTAALPPEVRIVESELENFPYQRLRKSAQTTVLEAAAHMAAGATGTAFNVLTMYKDPLEEYVPLYRRISQWRPFYKELQSALGRSPVQGVWPAWNQDLFSAVNVDGAWLEPGKSPLSAPYVLAEIGIPLCYDRAARTATALAGSAVFAFTREELQEIFRGGVLMDAEAWQALERLGLARWTGVRALENVDHDATEVLAPSPINGRFAGWSRDCRQSFWWERAYRLVPHDNSTEILARMADYGNRDLGPCMTAFTNELGGRVVLAGYYPWSQIHSLPKSSQLKAICEWLSRGRLPAVVESFAKVVIWSREETGGRQSLVLLNASLDPLESLSLRVRSGAQRFLHIPADGSRRELASERLAYQAGHVRVVLPGLAPWSVHLVKEA
ncbi:MAG TPA: hypothetical protein VFA33_23720 [Bryobacteraceae bacterium]|nr:hypothetical protein [Bryobacteraceae bacterium]